MNSDNSIIHCGNNVLKIRSSRIGTLMTIRGIGMLKAKKINSFWLLHPHAKMNKNTFITNIGIIARIKLRKENSIETAANAIKLKIINGCYQAVCLYQSKPMHGQNSKNNGGTSKRLNPYLFLEKNTKFYKSMGKKFMIEELIRNERKDELRAFRKNLLIGKLSRNQIKKQKSYAARQNFMRFGN